MKDLLENQCKIYLSLQKDKIFMILRKYINKQNLE